MLYIHLVHGYILSFFKITIDITFVFTVIKSWNVLYEITNLIHIIIMTKLRVMVCTKSIKKQEI